MKHFALCALILCALHTSSAGDVRQSRQATLLPNLSVQPDSITVTLATGDSALRTLTIGNTGPDTLVWAIPRLGTSTLVAARRSRIEQVVAEMRTEAKEPVRSGCSVADNHLLLPAAQGKWTADRFVNVAYADNPTSSPLNIALVHGEYDNTDPYVVDVQNKLIATRTFGSITLVAARSVTPTMDQLFAYDAVLVWSNYAFASGTTLGDNLADYVDGGGGVVLCQFAMDPYLSDSTHLLQGRFESGGYYAMLPGTDLRNTVGTLGTVYLSLHPVVRGVASFNGGSGSFHSNSLLSPGAVRIADWSDGQPLIVEKSVGGHRRIDLGFWPVSNDIYSGGWLPSTDGVRIMAQALVYVSEPSFLSVSPDSGTVAPGGIQQVQVAINARYFSAGAYVQTIPVTSNDPVHRLKGVPVHMTVLPPALTTVQFEVPLTVTDGVSSGVLYLGILPTADICIVGDSLNGHVEVFLPPPPPSGIFDTRFVSPRAARAAVCYDQGSVVDFRGFVSAAERDTFRVKTQIGSGSSLVASWPPNLSLYFTSLTLRYFDGSGNVNVNMLADTSVDFTLAGDPAVFTIYAGGLVLPVPGLQLTPSTIAFGNVHVLMSKRDSVTVLNGARNPYDVTSATSDDPHFTISPPSGTIPGQGSRKFFITFTPTSIGTMSARVVFHSNAILGQDTVLVSGTGVQGQFTVTPASVSFDSVLVTNSKMDSVQVKNPGTGDLTVSSIVSSDTAEFSVTEAAPLVIPPHDSTRVHITFHPSSPGIKTGDVTFTHDGSTLRDSIPVTGTGYVTVQVAVPVAADWNLISNPVTNPMPGDSVRQLFPTSLFTTVYEFSGGYVQRYRLANGKGYWGKFPAATMNVITGIPRVRDSISVTAGWNIIGSISNPVDTGTIASVPPGLRGSNWYGYSSAGFAPVTQILPGKGYWVKANADGRFVFANPLMRRAAMRTSAVDVAGVLHCLTISDSRGSSQTLYFGAESGFPVSEYDMPPRPPVGAFDARFSTREGGSMVWIHPLRATGAVEVTVLVQTDAYPLTVGWRMKEGGALYEIVDGQDGRGIPTKELGGDGSFKVTNESFGSFSIRLIADGQLPKEFALGQNYPNPFNPTTTITYDLPGDTRVSLKVFDLLGREVSTLVSGQQEAGYRSVAWNASGCASGIYFYRLEAGNFSAVKKLMLLR